VPTFTNRRTNIREALGTNSFLDRAAGKYRASRDAMLALSDPSVMREWNDTLPVLKAEDVRGLSEALVGGSEGKRRPSWIWTTNTGLVAGGADKAGDEGARTSSHQFARANANVKWYLQL
jgi:hypothetical protein